ncbi:MAG: calcium-binding protein, partial [Pseudoprimorskyibacter sp.]|nr:calcium-binding protein [Pseudoprimorskyibacter sp.]
DNDSIDGDAGEDNLDGGEGNDTINGGADDDSVKGNNGDDNLSGDAGDDTLLGGNGDDSLDGGTGTDSLVGGNGEDTLSGGSSDIMLGGNDDDDFEFTHVALGGASTINGGLDYDTVEITLANADVAAVQAQVDAWLASLTDSDPGAGAEEIEYFSSLTIATLDLTLINVEDVTYVGV